jgi:hypothetical protein
MSNKAIEVLVSTWFGAALIGLLSYFKLKGRMSRQGSDGIAYREGIGAVVEKLVVQGQYQLKFTYTEGSNTYQNALLVSQKKFDKAQVGDKIRILYGIHYPRICRPVTWGDRSVEILMPALAVFLFLIGAFQIYQAIWP